MPEDTDPQIRSEIEILKGLSRGEVEVHEKLSRLQHLSTDAWKDYTASAGIISDYIKLQDGGDDVDRPEWHRALQEVGEKRRTFATNAYDAIKGALDQARSHLATEHKDLEQVTKALEDVESAIHDAEEAKKLTEVIFRLKELAEFAEHPSVKKGYDLVRGKGSKDEHLIEQGIGNLAQYDVLLTLASHGFGSVEELKRRVETAHRNVSEAAETFEHYDGQEELAAEYKDWTYPT